MLLTIGFAIAAEDIRHFQLRALHGRYSGRGSRSSGLEVAQTLLAAMYK